MQEALSFANLLIWRLAYDLLVSSHGVAMISRKTFVLAAVLTAFLVQPAFAQVFFRMNYDAGASPAGGWPTAVQNGTLFTQTHVPGGGPQGEDSYDVAQRYTGSSAPGYGGEFYWGWNGNIESQNPAQGTRRYYRWRMRFTPTTNFRGVHQDGSATSLTNKVLIVGDGCGRDCRVIVNYRGGNPGQAGYLRIQIDGGSYLADTPPLNVGEWLDIQVELDSATTTSSGDGAYKLWVNNNNYSSPTAQRAGFQLNPVNWRYVMLGAYNNNGLASGGVHAWRQTGFEASTAFDAGWHRSGSSSTLPMRPTNLRITPP
jgi:hypothetical protein